MGGRNFVALLRSNGDLGYCHAEGPAILAGHGYLNIGWANLKPATLRRRRSTYSDRGL